MSRAPFKERVSLRVYVEEKEKLRFEKRIPREERSALLRKLLCRFAEQSPEGKRLTRARAIELLRLNPKAHVCYQTRKRDREWDNIPVWLEDGDLVQPHPTEPKGSPISSPEWVRYHEVDSQDAKATAWQYTYEYPRRGIPASLLDRAQITVYLEADEKSRIDDAAKLRGFVSTSSLGRRLLLEHLDKALAGSAA